MAVPRLKLERDVAELAVLRASIVTRLALGNVVAYSKTDHSSVTIADLAAQFIIIATVRAAFPNDGIVGEEDSGSTTQEDAGLYQLAYELVCSIDEFDGPSLPDVRGPSSEVIAMPRPTSKDDMLDMINLGRGQGGAQGRFWCLDPVDGTKFYIQKGQYAVSLALIQDGREILGVLGCPNVVLNQHNRIEEMDIDTAGLGIMLAAVRGQGSTQRHVPRRGAVPPATQMPRLKAPARTSDLHVVDSALSTAYDHDIVKRVAEGLGAVYPGTEVYSSHVRYAALIVGGGDFQLRVPKVAGGKMWIWDHAGAQLIFTEIGGKITDLDGKPIEFGAGRDLNRNRGMVAAKEDVHGQILAKVRECMGERKT